MGEFATNPLSQTTFKETVSLQVDIGTSHPTA